MLEYLIILKNIVFKVPPGHTKLDVIIKPVPGDTKLFFAGYK